jgi:iron complex transport system ATP-binding protein
MTVKKEKTATHSPAVSSCPILSAEGIAFSYGKTPVLDALNLDIAKGEFLGLIGPNGSGKTTFLKLLMHILSPSRGKVLFEGMALEEMKRREIAQKIAFVPQEENTNFVFSAMEMVLMGRSPYLKGFQTEGEYDLEVTKKAMSLTDCWQFKERDILTLSGGEKKRVFIARALAQEPEIILMDEPTTHLDLNHQVEIMEKMLELNKAGLTIIMVSHDINLASSFCTRLAVLKNGMITTSGTPGEIVNSQLLESVYGCRLQIMSEGKRPLVTLAREQNGFKGGDYC